jgi:type IV secretory pathway VirJ component
MMRRLLPVLLLILLIALGRLIPWPVHDQLLAHRREVTLSDGSLLQLFTPVQPTTRRALVLLPAKQALIPGPVLELVQQEGLAIGVLRLNSDCPQELQQIREAGEHLGGALTLVAGMDDTAPLAWQWLASQQNDKAQALTVGFNLSQLQCAQTLPDKAEHGHWRAVWNNNPDDASANFVRQQNNAESQISAYDNQPEQLLLDNLTQMIEGHDSDLPLVEVPASQASQNVVLFYSGDGGWRDLDRDVATQLAKRNLPVVGVDALRYFWQPKPPDKAAADLVQLMQHYRQRWGSQRFVLVGFSFGADVLPAIYNRLPAAERDAVDALVLLSPARTGSFEIHVQGWLGRANPDLPSGPELARLPASKLLCVYGQEEHDESGCTLPETPGEKLELPGGHHYDYDYPKLAERLIKAVQERQATAQPAH